MPIGVHCACGKLFNVRDELAGTTVKCQVCGATCMVPSPQDDTLALQAPTKLSAAPVSTEEKVACPACAEQISKLAKICPYCKEKLSAGGAALTEEETEKRLQELIQSIDQSPEIPLPKFSASTFVIWGFAGVGLLMFLSAFVTRGDMAGVLGGFGFLLLFIFGIASIVAFLGDSNAANICNSATATDAYKRYFNAVRTGRHAQAYAAVVPASRVIPPTESIRFNNPKIVHNPLRLGFSNVDSFKSYWKQVFTAPSQSRTITLKSATLEHQRGDGIYIVNAELQVVSFNSWLYLLIFVSLLVCVIVIYVVQAKDTVKVRKAFIKHEGKFYLLEGCFEGDLDVSV